MVKWKVIFHEISFPFHITFQTDKWLNGRSVSMRLVFLFTFGGRCGLKHPARTANTSGPWWWTLLSIFQHRNTVSIQGISWGNDKEFLDEMTRNFLMKCFCCEVHAFITWVSHHENHWLWTLLLLEFCPKSPQCPKTPPLMVSNFGTKKNFQS